MADVVNTEHADYQANKELWHKCRTAIDGEEAVKAAGAIYLPTLTNQTATEYEGYKMRAMFYEATGRTLQGLVGALHHKPPVLVGPGGSDKSDFFDSLVPNYMPFKSYIRDISEEILTTSRVGILVDVPQQPNGAGKAAPYMCTYCAEDIINWRCQFYEGKEVLVLVVLREKEAVVGQFETKLEDKWRVLELIDGRYQQTVWKENKGQKNTFYIAEGPIVPTKGGAPLDHIPFYFINSGGNTTYTYRPPLLALANVNFSHYRNSADLEHGRHYTGLPTAYIAGFETDAKSGTLQIGSSSAWVSTNPNAKAGFLEFTGQGLGALEKALESKEALMAILGARLLEAPKNVSESADNQIVKRSSENSVIANIADTVSEGMTKVCKEAAEWQNLDSTKVSVTVQREYLDIPADSALLAQLTASLQGGAISFDTYFYNLKRMKLVPDERTLDDEEGLIENGKFGGLAIPGLPGSIPPKKPAGNTGS